MTEIKQVSVPEETLMRHVMESNAIENIYAEPGDPLFDNHLVAALGIVGSDTLVHPVRIHSLIMDESRKWWMMNDPSLTCSSYRGGGVFVGGAVMPAATHVPFLMSEWWGAVTARVRSARMHSADVGHRKNIAWEMHCWFLCIHPFQDGNGRTARLVLNNILATLGFQWSIIESECPDGYMQMIRDYQHFVFEPYLRSAYNLKILPIE